MDLLTRTQIMEFNDVYQFQRTDRDERLISFLYENGYVLASQLMECGFGSRSALLKRLSLLKKGGLISSKRLGEFPLLRQCLRTLAWRGIPRSTQDWAHSKVYFLNPLIVDSHYKRKFIYSEEMVRHQIGLAFVREFLVKQLGPDTVLSEQKWLSQYGAKQREKLDLIPDLSMTRKEIKLAVEYERTIKDKSRYLSRWYDYDRSEFTHVLYYAETPAIFDRLRSCSDLTDRIGIVHLHEPSLIFKPRYGFISLDEFMEASFL